VLFFFVSLWTAVAADTARQTIVKAILEEDSDKKIALIDSLAGQPDPIIKPMLTLWKQDAIYLYKGEGDITIPVTLVEGKDAEEKQAAIRVEDDKPLVDAGGQPIRVLASDLDTAEHDSNLRTAMKSVTDLIELSAPDPAKRIQAIQTLGMSQDVEKLPALLKLQKTEQNSRTKSALLEAIALIHLKDEDPKVVIAACKELAALGSIPSQDFIRQLQEDSTGKPQILKAAAQAQATIATHLQAVNTMGTLFRGLSAGSILLVVAIGLAITFGLMGVINMAHGEIMVVGAYTTYVVQNCFGGGLEIAPFGLHMTLPGLHLTGGAYESFFIVALPVAFFVAAFTGIILERTVIRFLYRRPLESLLATWGVSLVLQQMFRLIFGANNVQVYSPSYLAGNWTVDDVILGWNRVFVIGFAVLIIVGTHLVLTRTPLGLLIRAVMQNRNMAACMGVRTERVYMFTFGLGSGLAGLAGAFLSQIGNVGPSLGQNYIVDAFMTVVVGGVGNIFGTVVSALSIGIVDQSLQQILLSPVLGKILVLVGIILFLQWRPAGLFVTKSRSLEG
jgi:urea transport system permease protein